jgi:hypothetical protein
MKHDAGAYAPVVSKLWRAILSPSTETVHEGLRLGMTRDVAWQNKQSIGQYKVEYVDSITLG